MHSPGPIVIPCVLWPTIALADTRAKPLRVDPSLSPESALELPQDAAWRPDADFELNPSLVKPEDRTKLCIPCEPEGKPLSRSLLDVLDADNYSVIGYWIDLVNRVGLHHCFIRYCVRCGFCRFGFGEWLAQIQNGAGKELHAEPRVEGRTTAKFAGPRDHRRLIMGIAAILCAYGGNTDVQADL